MASRNQPGRQGVTSMINSSPDKRAFFRLQMRVLIAGLLSIACCVAAILIVAPHAEGGVITELINDPGDLRFGPDWTRENPKAEGTALITRPASLQLVGSLTI